MPIPGATYQDYRWKEIKKLLMHCAVDTLLAPSDAEASLFTRFAQGLNRTGAGEVAAVELLPEWRGLLLQCLVSSNAPKNQYTDEKTELAMDLALLLFQPTTQLQRLFRDLAIHLQACPPAERQPKAFAGWVRTACGNILSELRYVADARNYAAATGRVCGVTHIRKLAKVEELNRKVALFISNQDVTALARLLGVPEDSLIGNELALRRAKRPEHRAALILALGGEILAQNRYGNLKSVVKVNECLQELEGILLVPLPDDDRLDRGVGGRWGPPDSDSDYDAEAVTDEEEDVSYDGGDEFSPAGPRHTDDDPWLYDLLRVTQDAEPDETAAGHSEPILCSPRISSSRAGPDAAVRPISKELACVIRELPRPVYLGLFHQWGLCHVLPEEVLAVFPGGTCSWPQLALLAGKTPYHLRQAVEQAAERLRTLRVSGDFHQ